MSIKCLRTIMNVQAGIYFFLIKFFFKDAFGRYMENDW